MLAVFQVFCVYVLQHALQNEINCAYCNRFIFIVC